MKYDMNTQPLISVIIPVYNVARYLDRCLRSIAAQREENLEIILVDDGSTDESPQLCDMWAEQDSRVIAIHQENGGAAAARNRGLDIARGEYILFVDADDYVSEDLCGMLLAHMDDTQQVDCTICGLAFVDDGGQQDVPQAVDAPILMSGIDALKDRYLHNRNRINIIGPCGKLFRRQLWEDLRFTNGLYYEDLDIAPYIFTKCRNIFCFPEIGYFYYQRAGSASHGVGTDDKRFLDSLMIREKHIAFYDEYGLPDISTAVRRMLLDLIITSDCNHWIPPSVQKYSRRLFAKYYRDLLVAAEISIKDKLRFSLYKIGGRHIYGWATGKK